MVVLLFLSLSQYSSSIYETARCLLRSRNTQARRADELAKRVKLLETENQRLNDQVPQGRRTRQCLQQLIDQQEQTIRQLQQQPLRLPSDLVVEGHQYGPKMIALCLNLSQRIGFRPTETAMKIFLQHLRIEAKAPDWSTIRTWACRLGLAQLREPVDAADDWIWMADHSNQIGDMKVLQILGVRASQLPDHGQTLRREDMRVLAVAINSSWKRDDVRAEYRKLADKIGAPQFLLTDGAVELRESADVLDTPERKVILLRDMKHVAANLLEKLIGKEEAFVEFVRRTGQTRSTVQQTELGHFTPPPPKPKSRFMNLKPTLRWGEMALFHLRHPDSQARDGISPERFAAKLGWLEEFADDLARWNRCHNIIETSLSFINHHGVYQGAADELQAILNEQIQHHPQCCPASQTLADQLTAFVQESESQLPISARAWLSTENLESSFGMFKQWERQHSKGGFTSLVAAMPTLLVNWTAERVRALLPIVKTKDLKQWVREELGVTFASARSIAYKEHKHAHG